MKKTLILVSLVVISALFFATINVAASSPASMEAKKTPGAQATLNALKHDVQATRHADKTPHNKKPQHFTGTIAAASETSLTLTLNDGSTQDFVIDESTQIKIPSLGKNGTFTDLAVGLKANIRARMNGEALTALSINVIPGRPVKMHRVGTVTEYTAGISITIQDKQGATYTFLITDSTKLLPADRADQLAVGSVVTIICPRDVTGGEPTAAGIIIHPLPGATDMSEATEATEVTGTTEATEATEATVTSEATEEITETTEIPPNVVPFETPVS